MRKQSDSLRQAVSRKPFLLIDIFFHKRYGSDYHSKYLIITMPNTQNGDGLKIIIDAAVANKSPADRSRLIRDSDGYAPTGEWIRKRIEETCEKPIDEIFKYAVTQHLSELKRLGRFPRHPIIGVDRTSFSRYDKDNPDLIKGRAKDGTTVFETHISAQLVNPGTRLVLSTFSVKKGEKNADFMPKIVDFLRNKLYKTSAVCCRSWVLFSCYDQILEWN